MPTDTGSRTHEETDQSAILVASDKLDRLLDD